jgi:hypothetical protein
MEEADVLKLFMIIDNSYSGFAYDDDKVDIWMLILSDVPFDLAQINLWKYIRNPENKFPPHPGALAESAVQSSNGPYILNAEETRLMLDDRDREYNKKAIKLPDHTRERVKLIGLPQRTIAGADRPGSSS